MKFAFMLRWNKYYFDCHCWLIEKKTINLKHIYWNEKKTTKKTTRIEMISFFYLLGLIQSVHFDNLYFQFDLIHLSLNHSKNLILLNQSKIKITNFKLTKNKYQHTWLIILFKIPNNEWSIVSKRNKISSIDWQWPGSRIYLHGRK